MKWRKNELRRYENSWMTHCTISYTQDGSVVFNKGADVLVDNCEVHHLMKDIE